MIPPAHRILRLTALTILILAIVASWRALNGSDTPEGVVAGNGRVEAVEINIATKIPGRVATILVAEGDFVATGQTLAQMDSSSLEAALREAQARQRKAEIGVDTAHSVIAQREAEKRASLATVEQARAEVDVTHKGFERSKKLAASNAVSEEVLDQDRAHFLSAQAALRAAEARVAAADAALSLARAQVISAQSDVAARQATVVRIQSDIDDGVLKAPRGGRIQYRVAEPGEVLGAGGVVLNLVDLSDVYLSFFLATDSAGRIPLGAEARIILDPISDYVLPATVSFVSAVAQFTPKTVETAKERQKLMFRIKATIDPAVLRAHIEQVKTGVPGVAYVRVDQSQAWPTELQIKLPE